MNVNFKNCPSDSAAPLYPSRRGFSLIEILVVIAIIGTIAALLVGASSHVRETSVRSRVKTELSQIATAIDKYHAKFGFYPPDNANDPAFSPLYYELTGNIEHQVLLSSADATTLLGVKGFVNSQPDENGRVPNFFSNLGVENKGFKKVNLAPDLYLLTVPAPAEGTDPDINPWRYVSRNPTNNTETYDLWAEVMVGNKKIVIGNWKD